MANGMLNEQEVANRFTGADGLRPMTKFLREQEGDLEVFTLPDGNDFCPYMCAVQVFQQVAQAIQNMKTLVIAKGLCCIGT